MLNSSRKSLQSSLVESLIEECIKSGILADGTYMCIYKMCTHMYMYICIYYGPYTHTYMVHIFCIVCVCIVNGFECI